MNLLTQPKAEHAHDRIIRSALPWICRFAAIILLPLQVHNSTAASFENTGSMGSARELHTLTMLTDGVVLAVGGRNDSSGFLSSAELYDPALGTWSATASMTNSRQQHTATLLPNGKVLVAGGFNSSGHLSSAEVYNPTDGSWTTTASMNTARARHTATLLPNGKVLVAGGGSSGAISSAELYDPDTGSWSFTGSLSDARESHTATLLPDGKVIVAGGLATSTYRASAELYNPTTGTWGATGSMNAQRAWHTATLLQNGELLVAGGWNSSVGFISSAELYDPSNGTWTGTGSLNVDRSYHTATLLCNGQVLVAGGADNSWIVIASAELFDPSTETWTATDSMNTERYSHCAILLRDGKVLISGGHDNSYTTALSSCELYDGGVIVISSWSFTDVGFVAGGQNGAFRSYSDPGDVTASPWSFQSPDKYSLRMSFENDNNCATNNNNPFTQTGIAEAMITNTCPVRMYVDWSGEGEQQDPSPQNPNVFEFMSLLIDEDLVGSAHAPGGGLGCAPMAPVVSDPAPPQFVDLEPGVHVLRIETTTNDQFYHVGAYYQFDLRFETQ